MKDQNRTGWANRAFFAVRQVIEEQGDSPFLAEDLRFKAAELLDEQPADPRNWGAVMRMAKGEGLIRQTGYAPARSSNRSPKVLWSRVN